jgi:hypothetical protein
MVPGGKVADADRHRLDRSSLWEERMKLNTISARLLAVGVAFFGVLTGVLFAADPASAATWTHLCLNNAVFDRCIYASGPNHAELADASTPGMTNWTYPTSVGATAAIKQANVNLCLQLDYAKKDSSGMPTVIGAACDNDDAEKWVNFYNTAHHRTMFQSYWAIKNLGGPLCLYGDENTKQLALYDCDPNYSQIAAVEDWSTS